MASLEFSKPERVTLHLKTSDLHSDCFEECVATLRTLIDKENHKTSFRNKLVLRFNKNELTDELQNNNVLLRYFVRKVAGKWPYFLHFLDRQDSSFNCFLLCISDTVLQKSASSLSLSAHTLNFTILLEQVEGAVLIANELDKSGNRHNYLSLLKKDINQSIKTLCLFPEG